MPRGRAPHEARGKNRPMGPVVRSYPRSSCGGALDGAPWVGVPNGPDGEELSTGSRGELLPTASFREELLTCPMRRSSLRAPRGKASHGARGEELPTGPVVRSYLRSSRGGARSF